MGYEGKRNRLIVRQEIVEEYAKRQPVSHMPSIKGSGERLLATGNN